MEIDDDDDDDLLFFIYKIDKEFINNQTLKMIKVFRKLSNDLPLLNPEIDWPKTTFLNIILQKLNYQILYSVLTRTSVNHYHVLSKQKIPVFSSPSEHSVLYKEKIEEYTYPMINFHVDNYEEYLFENVLNYLEIIYIELLASYSPTEEPSVLLSFSISHESIDNAYCEKVSFLLIILK